MVCCGADKPRMIADMLEIHQVLKRIRNLWYIISVLSIVPQQYRAEITNISVWPQEKFKMKFKRAG